MILGTSISPWIRPYCMCITKSIDPVFTFQFQRCSIFANFKSQIEIVMLMQCIYNINQATCRFILTFCPFMNLLSTNVCLLCNTLNSLFNFLRIFKGKNTNIRNIIYQVSWINFNFVWKKEKKRKVNVQKSKKVTRRKIIGELTILSALNRSLLHFPLSFIFIHLVLDLFCLYRNINSKIFRLELHLDLVS